MTIAPHKRFKPSRTLMLVLGAMIVTPLVAVIGYLVATDPSPYERVLGELRFPEAWLAPHADVEQRAILLGGARMTRFYLVDADPAVTASVVEQVVTAAGFTINRSWGQTCHRNPSDGPIESCTVAAIRDRIHLWVVKFARGARVSYSFQGGEPTAGAPNLSVVRVQAGGSY
jgi:hypothetical protein